MAYQPIQIADPDWYGKVSGIYEAARRARLDEQERERHLADMLLSRQQADTQSQYARNQQEQLELKRREDEANALQSMYGMDPQQFEMLAKQRGWNIRRSPVMGPGPQQAPQRPSGGSPVPDAMEFGGIDDVARTYDFSRGAQPARDRFAASLDEVNAPYDFRGPDGQVPQGYMPAMHVQEMASRGMAPQQLPKPGQPQPMPDPQPQIQLAAPQATRAQVISPQPAQQQPGEKWQIDFGNGRAADYDPEFARTYKRGQLDQEAARVTAIAQERLPKEYADIAIGMIQSDPSNPRAGYVEALKMWRADEAEQAAITRDEKRAGWAMDRTRAGASLAGARARANRDTPSATQMRDDARADMQAYLGQTGYKLDQASARQFQRMEGVAAEAAKGNPMAARVFMGQYVKFAQGEVGVLNESDLDNFWNNAGSPKDRSEEALAKIVSGGLGEQKRINALKAIQSLSSTVKARLDGARSGAEEIMAPYGADGQRYINAFFGRGSSAQTDETSEQKKARMVRTGGKGAPAPTSVNSGALKLQLRKLYEGR